MLCRSPPDLPCIQMASGMRERVEERGDAQWGMGLSLCLSPPPFSLITQFFSLLPPRPPIIQNLPHGYFVAKSRRGQHVTRLHY